MKAFLDTHAAVLLWNGDSLGPKGEELLQRSAIFVSPVVRLELAYLREIGRFDALPDEILGSLVSDLGVYQSEDTLSAVVERATDLEWTRDPFDRFLVATAMLHRAPLVTKDERILRHFADAVW